MSLPKYAVVIPAHDAEGTIEKCLNSVLDQTVPASQIIVVSDSCTDKTNRILNTFAQSKLLVLNVNFRNSAQSRNFGVDAAEHDFIAFLDADDTWFPTKIEKQLLAIQSSNQDIIIGTDSIFLNIFGTFVGRNVRTRNDEEAMQILRNGIAMPTLLSTWLLPRKTFQRLGGFDTKFPMSEDFEFANRAIRSGTSLAIIREPLSTYLLHSSSKTAKYKLKQARVADYVRLVSQASIDCSVEEFLSRRSSIFERRDAVVDIQIRKFLMFARESKFRKNYFRLILALILNPIKLLKKYKSQRK